jgi:hypothetical protein
MGREVSATEFALTPAQRTGLSSQLKISTTFVKMARKTSFTILFHLTAATKKAIPGELGFC